MEIPPFELRHPPHQAVPLVFDLPHSGRHYPADFRYKPSLVELRRGEDAFVDQLLVDAPEHGATMLIANYPRCYIDVNRSPDDIDAELLAEPWPEALQPTEKTKKGLGLIRRYVVPGMEVHRDRLSVAEVRHRLDEIYWPYHHALRPLLDQTRNSFGLVWHIDWHSMKSIGNAMTDDPGQARPDFVLGNQDGTTSGPEVMSLVADTLKEFGYSVGVNSLYKGGHIVRGYGAPADGIHSMQIEMNRALYLDEARIECHEGAAKLRQVFTTLTQRMANALRDRIAQN